MHAPVLLEDGSSLDWPSASYSPTIGIGDQMARIEHRVEGAPSLTEMVERGEAVWAVELRCPKTLFARTSMSKFAEHAVRWDEGDIDGPAWLIPGLLATTDLSVTDTDALHEVWHDASPSFPAGFWIARGDARRVTPFRDSLLSFQLDITVPPGRMAVESDRSTGDLRFVVRAAADVHHEAMGGNRAVLIAALVGVCGHFPREFGSAADDEPGGDDGAVSALADELRERLGEAGVATWDDIDLYDPAAAATALEPFAFAAPTTGLDGHA